MNDLEAGIDLRHYVERIFDEREKAALVASKNLDERLEKLNELRAEVMRDRDQFLRKDVYDQQHGSLSERVVKVEQFQSKTIGVVTVLVLGSGILGAVVMHVFFGR